jgi:hypothetical protein
VTEAGALTTQKEKRYRCLEDSLMPLVSSYFCRRGIETVTSPCSLAERGAGNEASDDIGASRLQPRCEVQ